MSGGHHAIFGAGHAPIGWTVGFLRAPFATVLRATVDWRRSLLPEVGESDISGPFPDAFVALAPLETPPTREMLVRTSDDQWTANLVNTRLGGDSSSWCGYLSGVIGCDAVEATHIPTDQYRYPATSLNIVSPRAPGPLHSLRSISAGKYDSGRWEFVTTGQLQPFERTQEYTLPRVRDRFDRRLLVLYLEALGIRVDDPEFWVGATLLQHRVTFVPRASALGEIRREYGIE